MSGRILCAVLAVFLLWSPMIICSQGVAGRRLLLVANKIDRTLSMIDPESGQQLAVVAVGGITGHEVAASPDGQIAWVPIYGNSGVGVPGTDGQTISVIDLKTHAQIASVDLGQPSRPHSAVFNPTDGKLYVTAELTRSIKVIDPARREVVDSIPTGAPESHMLAISSDGQHGYTANVGQGTVSAINLRQKKVLTVIPVSKSVQRIAITPDGRWVFTADQVAPNLAVIDTQSNTVKRRIQLPVLGFGLATTHDGRRLLVTHPSSDSVSVVDLKTMTVEKTIPVPAAPQEILVRPDNRVAYVSCDQSKQIVAIDLGLLKIDRTIRAGAGADGLAWAVQR